MTLFVIEQYNLDWAPAREPGGALIIYDNHEDSRKKVKQLEHCYDGRRYRVSEYDNKF